jgi:hypothetical protein
MKGESNGSDDIGAGPDALRHPIEHAVQERMLAKPKRMKIKEMLRLDVFGRLQEDHQRHARFELFADRQPWTFRTVALLFNFLRQKWKAIE